MRLFDRDQRLGQHRIVDRDAVPGEQFVVERGRRRRPVDRQRVVDALDRTPCRDHHILRPCIEDVKLDPRPHRDEALDPRGDTHVRP
ncbi:hypothetical protein QP176_18090 [Sphingomonas aerolata]